MAVQNDRETNVGQKTELKMQVNEIFVLKPHQKLNFSKYYRKYVKVRMHFHPVLRVPVDEICTFERLAEVVYRHCGCGHYYCMFWCDFQRNRRYDPSFVCTKPLCAYFLGGKCWQWKTHMKGFQCKKNRKFKPTWKKRVELVITESDSIETPYTIRVPWSKMNKFWFFKGHEKNLNLKTPKEDLPTIIEDYGEMSDDEY